MKYILILLYFISYVTISFGQVISSQLVDSETNHVIQYANIGVIGTNVGTVSDSLGNFTLSLNDVANTDSLRISMIGYESRTYHINELVSSAVPKQFHLDKKAFQLQEIVITSEDNKPYQLGLKKKFGYPIPIYKAVKTKVGFPQNKYHNEIGTRLKIL